MSIRTAAIVTREPAVAHLRAVRPMVAATGLFRAEEVEIAAEVFEGAVRQPGKDYHALGAFDEDAAMLGFVCFGPTPGTAGTWDLYWIVVDPAAQRQGIGTELLGACEQAIEARGGRLVVVETSSRADYAATRGFYVARGYRRAARIGDYYAPDDDLIVYTKSLLPSAEGMDHG